MSLYSLQFSALNILITVVLSWMTMSVEKCHIPLPDDLGPGLSDRDMLMGDTVCSYGSEDCNPCVDGLLDQLSGLESRSAQGADFTFKNGDLDVWMNVLQHPQGVARLTGVEDENWMLITKNHFGKAEKAGVVSIRFGDILSDGSSLQSGSKEAQTGQMTQLFSTADNTHPGGCQLIGHTLAVAHEGAVDRMREPTWISFYDVSDPRNINESNRFRFDGLDAHGIPYQLTDKGQAICVGVTRLADGHYLMFALESRRRLPSDVGWFFISTSTDLTSTDWSFIQFWHQDLLKPDKDAFRTYENINLVTDCSDGSIYMLGFYGKATANAIDVFSLTRTDDHVIRLTKVMEKRLTTQRGGGTFRAGGSIHITPDNEVVVYAVEKAGGRLSLRIEEFTGPTAIEDKVPVAAGNQE